MVCAPPILRLTAVAGPERWATESRQLSWTTFFFSTAVAVNIPEPPAAGATAASRA